MNSQRRLAYVKTDLLAQFPAEAILLCHRCKNRHEVFQIFGAIGDLWDGDAQVTVGTKVD